jgi:PD-(D/E)XK nuclease superfamily
VAGPLTREQLEAVHCWEAGDRVPGDPETTLLRRRLRYHQAAWRDAHGLPIGTQPILPRPGSAARPVGSRLPLGFAEGTAANFVTTAAQAAARARTSYVERHQSFDHQRWWAELLWSPSLAVNLFGELAHDLAFADRAVHSWWPDAPGTVTEVRFAHSPGRFDPSFLDSLRDFAAAFLLDHRDGTRAVIAVDVKYHDYFRRHIPKPEKRPRRREVAQGSGLFSDEVFESLDGWSTLCTTWLEHLLLLSMLQHESGGWTWGRYVVVHPAAHRDVAAGCARYRDLLHDDATFGSMTIEDLLDSGALPRKASAALRDRYLPSD